MEISWGIYTQSNSAISFQDIELIGSQLSLVIGCPVHYPAYNKKLFECKCGILFPYYVVSGCIKSKENNLNILRDIHKAGGIK